jgi:hypothetical protein
MPCITNIDFGAAKDKKSTKFLTDVTQTNNFSSKKHHEEHGAFKLRLFSSAISG